MTTEEKPTFKSQLFSGFFLVFWALVIALVIAVIVDQIRQALGYEDLGIGPWWAGLGVALVLAAFPVGINYFNREARAARNG
jgi:hypothetical protein